MCFKFCYHRCCTIYKMNFGVFYAANYVGIYVGILFMHSKIFLNKINITIHAVTYFLIFLAFFCRRYRLHDLFHQKISELFRKI
jgi:uncharacterized RDD family membrane protein YckC